MMIKICKASEIDRMYSIINEAAMAYEGEIPSDCYHQPYMPMDELQRELKRMTFFGWYEDEGLEGVMALEPSRDVSLVRHAYVWPEYQGKGIGGKLIRHIIQNTNTPRLLVGTWADAVWAIDFYKKYGFVNLTDKDDLLKKYWDISQRQIETSVVLGKDLTGLTHPNPIRKG
jgi:GNAT superfamily N-acetyltransferase